ncbi:nitrogen fixation protein NifQ [Denitrificimonas caeni]|uniref:nitrogen fixation protein NifQ n=1 Tax=Denitrificimonas caeni TaxID=521720 RepID=UPI00196584DD|nr:nitrogen fixation protein NifQ [Denitrificimonas caeni]
MDSKALSFLMFRAVRGVIRRAQSGDLPLFACTLGLPFDQYLAMMAYYFPEHLADDECSEARFTLLQANMPADFSRVLDKILSLCADAENPQLTQWLAHAIASAAYGEQALWESMELANALQLQALLACRFPQWSMLKCGVMGWQASLLEHAPYP